MWALLEDGTDSAMAHDVRLQQRSAALHALVGSRVWTPGIPEGRDFENLQAAVWFAEVVGAGIDEHGEDVERSFEFTCVGGTTDGTGKGRRSARTAESVARAVAAVLSCCDGLVTPYGVIVSCVPETGFVYGIEEHVGWPWWKQVWSITTGAS